MKRVKPMLKDKKMVMSGKVKIKQSAPRNFDNFTVVWVQPNGVPFDTTGFRARLIRRGRIVATARFDRFGVAVFRTIDARTRVAFTLQTIDEFGVVFRIRRVPAGVQVFAVIG